MIFFLWYWYWCLCFISGKSYCDQCPAGYYCLTNTSDPFSSSCPVGHYCPPGTQTSTQYKCPAGTYNPNTTMTNQTSCLMCPAGSFCLGEGQSEATGNCSAGWFCTGGAYAAKPLTLGKDVNLIYFRKKDWVIYVIFTKINTKKQTNDLK